MDYHHPGLDFLLGLVFLLILYFIFFWPADTGISSDYIDILKTFLIIHYSCLLKEYSRQAQRMLLFISAAFSLINICRYYLAPAALFLYNFSFVTVPVALILLSFPGSLVNS